MNTFEQLRYFAKPALLTLPALFLAGAANAAPTWAVQPATDWKVAQVSAKVIRVANTVDAGTLHAVCAASGCELFVEPKSGCIPGSMYPVLVNSANKVGAIPARCLLITDGNKPSLVVHLTKSKQLMPAMVRGEEVSIAFPTHVGKMNVLNIRMAGVADLLANAMRTSGMAARSGEQSGKPAAADSDETAPPAAKYAGKTQYHI